jgi:hypothetical protein
MSKSQREITCPLGHKAHYTLFREVMLISAHVPSDSHPKHEILYAKVCPECNVVFFDRSHDNP